MGTDVHMIVERRFGEKWIGVWASDYLPEHWWDQKETNPETLTVRHYRRFGALAGVRGDGPDAKGLPDDASELSRSLMAEKGYHSVTWWTLAEARKIYRDPDTRYVGEEPTEFGYDHFVRLVWSDEEAESYRVIFGFDS